MTHHAPHHRHLLTPASTADERKRAHRRLLLMLGVFTAITIIHTVFQQFAVAERYLDLAEHASLLCDVALMGMGQVA